MIALLIIGIILMVVGGIWFLVVAFKESIVWGLVVLFVPFAFLVFLVKYWPKAKASFGVQLVGTVMYFWVGHSMIGDRILEYRQLAAAQQHYREHAHETGRDSGLDMGAPQGGANSNMGTNAGTGTGAPAASHETEPTPKPASITAPPPAPVHRVARPPRVIRLAKARDHIGELLRIITTGDVTRVAMLRAVHANSLVFEQDVSGGSLTFTMRPDQIARLETMGYSGTQ